MTKKQIRYGAGNTQKARLAPITEQQISAICDVTGENKNECVQSAITERYMRIVYSQQEKRVQELEAHILKLESQLIKSL